MTSPRHAPNLSMEVRASRDARKMFKGMDRRAEGGAGRPAENINKKWLQLSRAREIARTRRASSRLAASHESRQVRISRGESSVTPSLRTFNVILEVEHFSRVVDRSGFSMLD